MDLKSEKLAEQLSPNLPVITTEMALTAVKSLKAVPELGMQWFYEFRVKHEGKIRNLEMQIIVSSSVTV